MLTPTGVTVSAYNAAVKADALTHIRMTFMGQNLVFDDADFVQGGVTITDILNGDTDLTIGSAVMKQVTAEMYVSTKTRQLVWENEFQLEIGIDVGGTTRWVTIGYFTGERPEKLNSEGVVLFTANDRMGKFDILADDWMNSIDYTTPQTVQDLFDSLCSYVGLTNTTGDELSGIMSRSYSASPFASGGILCRNVLGMIAEATGCYAKITNEGKVKLVWFADHTDYELTGDDEFKIDSLGINFSDDSMTWQEMESFTWEDLEQMRWSDIEYYQQQLAIKALNVVQTVDDIGVTVPTGSTATAYMIVDNPFLTTASDADVTAYIDPIYDRLANFGGYLPLSMECVGNPCVEAGDIITVAVKGESVALPIFCKTMVCNGSCTDNYEATGNVKREKVPFGQREKLSTGGRYHVWKNTVDELYSELYDPTTGDVSVLQQTASALGLTAAGIDIVGTKYVKIESGGSFNLDTPTFKISSNDKWLKTGYWTFNDSMIQYDNNSTMFFGIVPDTLPARRQDRDCTYIQPFGNTLNIHAWSSAVSTPASWQFVHNSDGTCVFYLPLLGNSKQNSIKNIEKLYVRSTTYCDIYSNVGFRVYENDSSSTPWASLVLGTFGGKFTTYQGFFDEVYANVYPPSSREVKHDINALPASGDIIDSLEPVSFKYNDDKKGKTHYGLIYEDTIEKVPDICNETENGTKGINYTEIIPLLLKEIQDLRKRVAELERRVK